MNVDKAVRRILFLVQANVRDSNRHTIKSAQPTLPPVAISTSTPRQEYDRPQTAHGREREGVQYVLHTTKGRDQAQRMPADRTRHGQLRRARSNERVETRPTRIANTGGRASRSLRRHAPVKPARTTEAYATPLGVRVSVRASTRAVYLGMQRRIGVVLLLLVLVLCGVHCVQCRGGCSQYRDYTHRITLRASCRVAACRINVRRACGRVRANLS